MATDKSTPAEDDSATAASDDGDGDETQTSGVKVPEEFQQSAMALVESCNSIQQLDFLSSEINDKRKELMKEESATDQEMSTDNMPSMEG